MRNKHTRVEIFTKKIANNRYTYEALAALSIEKDTLLFHTIKRAKEFRTKKFASSYILSRPESYDNFDIEYSQSKAVMVNVNVEPSDFKILIDGELLSSHSNGEKLILEAGNHWVEIYKEGYHPIKHRVNIRGNNYNNDLFYNLIEMNSASIKNIESYESDLILKRHTDVRFPKTTVCDKWNDLRIQIIQAEKISDTGEVIDVPKPSVEDITVEMKISPEDTTYVTIRLTAENFDIRDSWKVKTVEIPHFSDSEPIFWQLKPLMSGLQRITLDFYHESKYIGTVNLSTIVSENEEVLDIDSSKVEYDNHDLTIDNNFINPDLTIRVHSGVDPESPYYEFVMDSPFNKLDICAHSCKKKLDSSSKNWCENQFSELENLLRNSTGENINRHLESMGRKIYENLMPRDLQEFLKESNKIKTINIISDEPYIPWEMAYYDNEFLCEKYEVTRWLSGKCSPQKIDVNKSTIIAITEGIEQVINESNGIYEILCSKAGVAQIDQLTCNDFVDLFKNNNSDIYHFACHGEFQTDGDLSFLKLADGDFRACWLNTINLINDPLVFINACQSGRNGLSLTGMGGWINEFNDAGAGAIIGSMWSIEDRAAKEFAIEFYRLLIDGKTLGEAAKGARQKVKIHDQYYTWIAYTVYGDPNAKFNFSKE